MTNVFTTPTAVRAMMSVEDAGRRYPQRFRIVCAAGEPLNPEAIRWFRREYGVTVLDYYGLTESYPLCANFPFMEVREGSMGRPMPGWEVQILDDDERPVRRGERGEICLRARSNPHYPLGYWRNDEAARQDFGGEWFHTKDAARQDEDGYVWYEGRADDVIISAGYRIGPFEVESACLEHQAVAEAAAVASPDDVRGHVVKAFIRLAEGHEPSETLGDEISAFVRGRLGATRIRARSSSSRICRKPSPARSGGSSCASASSNQRSDRGQWGDAARAAATASSRELTPRARKRRRMWFLTVSMLRWSSAAICFVERPCSRRRSTST